MKGQEKLSEKMPGWRCGSSLKKWIEKESIKDNRTMMEYVRLRLERLMRSETQ